MKITTKAFQKLFNVHLPPGVPSAWVQGVQYIFVAGTEEIGELERLLQGVTSGKL